MLTIPQIQELTSGPYLARAEWPEDFFTKKLFPMALLFVTLCAVPSVFAQSKEAIEACRDVNPPGVWQERTKEYESKRQDLAWQAEQRRQEEQRRREVEVLQQQQRQRLQSGTNCTYAVVGGTVPHPRGKG
jgi:hypothetical protein